MGDKDEEDANAAMAMMTKLIMIKMIMRKMIRKATCEELKRFDPNFRFLLRHNWLGNLQN